MYLDNNWYGDRYIFSKYCRVKDKPAFASIQHGYLPIKNYKSNEPYGKRTITSTPWLVWNDKIAMFSNKRGIKNIIPIGSVFIYLEKIYFFKIKKKPRGTLIFPVLSQPQGKVENDFDKIVKYLKKNYSAPYTISVSTYDIKRIKKKYKDVKFLTFGSRGDQNYLKKLFLEISNHRNVVCVYPGSPLIYSIYLKKKVNISKEYFLKNLDKLKKKEIRYDHNLFLKDLSKYGINIKNLNDKMNRSKIKIILGNKFIKTPKELKKILGWNSIFKILMAKFFTKIINIKENIVNGFNYAELARVGKNYSKETEKRN